MPYISKHERARGGYAADGESVDLERDWSIPTNYDTLRRRPPAPVPTESRYGAATTDPRGREGPGWHKGANGLPVKTKEASV